MLSRLPDHWYVACLSDELRDRPLSRSVHGAPIVLFRDERGRPAALLDRCPHRNVPLSAGVNAGGQLECAYHGWRFDAEGICRRVPALLGAQEGKARRVPRYAAREEQGFVWVYGRADVEPTSEPYRVPLLGEPGLAVVRYTAVLESTMFNAAENALDVPHTAFLHRGLFRGGRQSRIAARVRRLAGGVEAEYLGEPRPSGLLGRLLAPGGGTVRHFDRFLLPAIVQVEYALGESSHLLITNLLTPAEDFRTRMFAVATLRLPFGARVAARFLRPFVRRVVAQDQRILTLQTATTRRFGGEQYVSTAVDVLGPAIQRLLRQAERGEAPPAGAELESEVELLA